MGVSYSLNCVTALLYNIDMSDHRWRQVLGLIVLLVSLAILIWGFWPYADQTRVMPIQPADMLLPTPESFLWLAYLI